MTMTSIHSNRQFIFSDESNDKNSISVIILEVFQSKNPIVKNLFIHMLLFSFSVSFCALSRHLMHRRRMDSIFGHVRQYLLNIFGTIEMRPHMDGK